MAQLTEEDYLKNRVEDQFTWMEGKAARNKTWYYRLRTVVVLCSVSIPILTNFLGDDGSTNFYIKIAIGVLGGIITLCEGIVQLRKYPEIWTQYRVAAEALKRERFLYETRSGKYEALGEGSFHAFVMEIEKILASENAAWQSNLSQKNQPAGGAGTQPG